MTDRIEHLRALHGAVRDGVVAHNDVLWMHLPITLLDGGKMRSNIATAVEAYNGSLDAALALHNAVLPGEQSQAFITLGLGGGAIIHGSNDGTRPDAEAALFGSTPARAWLLAILSALIAMEEGK